FGLLVITHFVHDLETVLDRVRNSEIGFDANMSTLVLECRDHISELVDCIEAGGNAEQVSPDMASAQAGLTARLKAYLLHEEQPSGSKPVKMVETGNGQQTWHVSVRLGRSTLCDGFDPAPIFSYMERKQGQNSVPSLHTNTVGRVGEFVARGGSARHGTVAGSGFLQATRRSVARGD
ncbi:MAG: hypothetical protein VW447_11105, partial [Limnobacter sp.]